MNDILTLWGKRWSTAWGWRWVRERDTEPENVEAWLAVYRKHEPDIEFVVSAKKPRIPKPK